MIEYMLNYRFAIFKLHNTMMFVFKEFDSTLNKIYSRFFTKNELILSLFFV